MIRRNPYGAPLGGGPTPAHAPNAALLIDFDNVTVGIRSDLGKELRALLNSDIIKGKVAVQRAYADWRRYPQYIVPLTEASVDLIFAPAYGTSKKNATDLRMAVDAIELVFTRPEIGTFILLTGDSDFSSCVLKLKEYGKYVIGVGMRESSSDLLIQNCDEYYSYHSLSGLTRATVGGGMAEDPWQLVREAVRQMAESGDAMRADRLKQVMLNLDPGFDEKKIGYSKFSRFVQEAASKGLLRLRRGEGGQQEIALPDEEEAPARREARVEEAPRERDRDRDRGRGRGRDRDRGRGRGPRPEPRPEEVLETPAVGEEEPEVMGVLEQVKGPEPAVTVTGLDGAYALLQHAVRSLVGRGGTARDAEVKRKMLEMAPGFDEGSLGFGKFSRFLRQAHDAEAIDLRRMGENHYEVALPASGKRLPTPELAAPEGAAAEAQPEEPRAEEAAPQPRGRRGRRGGRPEGPPPILPDQVVTAPTEAEAPAAEAPAETPAAREERAPAPTAEPLGVEAAAAGAATAAPTGRVGLRGRGGSRGRHGAPDAPPPLLPGQVIPSRAARQEEPAPAAEAAPAPEAAPTPEAPAAEAPAPRARTRGRGRKKAEVPAPGVEAAPAAPPAPPAFSAEALGLPTDEEAIANYLTNSYKGVGKKTAESLLNAVGTDVFRVMEEEPARVREVLGDRRANALLEQWAADVERRRESAREEALPVPADETPEAVAEAPAAEAAAPKRKRTRGRGRKKAEAAPAAEPAAAEPAAEAPAAEAEAPAAEEAAGPQRGRTRGRRGGRGRGKKGGNGGEAAPAEAPAAEAPAPAPEAAAEGGEGEGGKAAARSRSRTRRGGRGRGKKKDEAPAS